MKKFEKKGTFDLNKRIEAAEKAVETLNKEGERNGEEEKIFVRATYTTLSLHPLVMINVPGKNATHMNFCHSNCIVTIADKEVSKLKTVDVPSHYIHGDCMKRNQDGSSKPKVVRHFYVSPDSIGRRIPAIVEIKKKVDVATEEETILIDIFEFKIKENLEVKHELRLNVDATGAPGEILIPGMAGRCIKIQETMPIRITC